MTDVSLTTPTHTPPLVLLVDDDADTREMYGLYLTSRGFAVDEARDAEYALRKVRSELPDVVVTDIKLHALDGFALCREIKRDERTALIPVIAVTGYSTPTRVEEAKQVGFDAFLLKPVPPDDLVAQIESTIQAARVVRAQSKKLQAESVRLHRDTQAVLERTAATLKRVSEDADKRHRERCLRFAMTDTPMTALELRERCMGLSPNVVADAVVAAFKELRPAPSAVLPPDGPLFAAKMDRRQPRSTDDASLMVLACFVARWLTDRDLAQATLDKPPRLSPELQASIWRHVCERDQTLTAAVRKSP